MTVFVRLQQAMNWWQAIAAIGNLAAYCMHLFR
jgi:hypothetical protein